jgi:hypothetical protein
MTFRLTAAGMALVAFAVPLLVTRAPALVVAGLVGLLLAAAGIATLWRWLATAAAGVLLVDYAVGLSLAPTAPSVVAPTIFGLSLLIFLHSVELARTTRRATLDPALLRSLTLGWAGFGGATVAAVMLLAAVAGGLASTLSLAAAPFLAAAGALGVLVTVATLLRRSHEA